MDYKDSLNLPRTDFAMKADLVAREPQRLERWQSAKLYEQIQQAREGAEKFILHDGPPFAKGGPSCRTNFSASARAAWIFS